MKYCLFVLSNETTFPSGTGYKNTKQGRYHQKETRLMSFYHLDETLIKVVGSSEYIWL
jgi:hypothetical protein